MFFNAANMSADEYRFIRTYVRVLQYRYDALQTVMAYMHPENLGLTSVLTAANVEHKMALMHVDFEQKLHDIAENDKLLERRLPKSGPSPEELADIVMLSFFKVVGVMSKGESLSVLANPAQGWFSGKPAEWESMLKKLMLDAKSPEQLLADDVLSKCLNAIAKLFPGYNKKIWSNLQPPNYKKKFYFKDEYDPYFDDYEDDEEDDDDDYPHNPY